MFRRYFVANFEFKDDQRFFSVTGNVFSQHDGLLIVIKSFIKEFYNSKTRPMHQCLRHCLFNSHFIQGTENELHDSYILVSFFDIFFNSL